MGANDFIIKAGQGKDTILDKAYSRLIKNIQLTLDDENKERWEVYNSIIQELINDKKLQVFSEIKYRLTDGENPTDVFQDILNREYEDGYLWYLRTRIEEFINEDLIKRFL